MEDLLASVFDYLAHHEGPLAYAILALAAGTEYVFPPFPGDLVVTFGAYLAIRSGYNAPLVYIATLLGSLLGAMIAYAIGRWIPTVPEHRPRWLRGDRADKALERVDALFKKRGAVILVANRFVPFLRGFFFVGAGLARLPWPRVLAWGSLSAAAFNAMLFGAAAYFGSFQDLKTAGTRFAAAAAVVMALGAIAAFVRRRTRAAEDIDKRL